MGPAVGVSVGASLEAGARSVGRTAGLDVAGLDVAAEVGVNVVGVPAIVGGIDVSAGLSVGVTDRVEVGVGVGLGVDSWLGFGMELGDGVGLGVGTSIGAAVGVAVGAIVGVAVGVGGAVEVGAVAVTHAAATRLTITSVATVAMGRDRIVGLIRHSSRVIAVCAPPPEYDPLSVPAMGQSWAKPQRGKRCPRGVGLPLQSNTDIFKPTHHVPGRLPLTP